MFSVPITENVGAPRQEISVQGEGLAFAHPAIRELCRWRHQARTPCWHLWGATNAPRAHIAVHQSRACTEILDGLGEKSHGWDQQPALDPNSAGVGMNRQLPAPEQP